MVAIATYQASCHLDRIQQVHIIQEMESLHQAITQCVLVLTDMKFTLIVWGKAECVCLSTYLAIDRASCAKQYASLCLHW